MTKNTAVAVQTDYSVMADAVQAAAKAYVSSENSRDNTLVKTIAPAVYLAFSTGYVVPTKGMNSDEKKALTESGHISQTSFRQLFVSKSGNTPDDKTIKRWAVLGAAVVHGADAKVISALKNSAKAAKVIAALGHTPGSADEIVAALEAAPVPAKREATPNDGTTPEGPTALQALVAIAGEFTGEVVKSMTKAERTAFMAALDSLNEASTQALAIAS